MYKCVIKTKVLNSSETILPDGFSSIRFVNQGNDPVTINGNIQLAGSKDFFLETRPDVIVDQDFSVAFLGAGNNPNVLVISYYFKH